MKRPFVGRRDVVATLERAIGGIRSSGGPVVTLLEGDAGIGKTALLDRIEELAGDAGLVVRRAAGDEDEAHVPGQVVRQLVPGDDPHPAHRARAERAEHEPSALGSLLVEAIRADAGSDAGSDAGAGAGADAGAGAGDPGAGRAGTALLVDDAQWADPPSLRALVHAVRRLGDDAVLLVVAARGITFDLEGIARLADRPSGIRHQLGGLDPTDVLTLAPALGVAGLSLDAAGRLVEHTGGNPLWLTALLHEVPRGALEDLGVPLPAPQTYAPLVLSRLEHRSPAARDLLAAAAVLGRRAPLHVAAELARVDRPLEALDELVRAGLLDAPPATGPAVIAFTHPLVRSTVYHGIEPGRRLLFHERASALVDDDVATLRHRLAATIAPDAELSADLAAAADLALARGAWHLAADHFTAAARCGTSADGRRRHLLAAAECCVNVGEVARALWLLDEVGEPDDDLSRYVASQPAFLIGQHGRAYALLTEAWAGGVRDRDPALAGRIAALLADVCAFRLQPVEAVDWVREAWALAPEAITVPFAASSLRLTGHRAEAERLAADPTVGDRHPSSRLAADAALGFWSGDLGAARTHLQTAVTSLPAGAAFRERAVALFSLEVADYPLGQWDDILARVEEVTSLTTDAGVPQLAATHHALAAVVAAERGATEAAEAHLVAADELAAPGLPIQTAHLAMARARVALAEGDADRAVAATESALPVLAGTSPLGMVDWRSPYIEALLGVGRVDDAEAVLAPFESAATAADVPLYRTSAARLRGLVAVAHRDPDGAVDAFEHALAQVDRTGAVVDRAQVELAYGSHLRRRGRRRDAARLLRSAQARFATVGARPLVERCERELGASGLRPTSRRERRWTELTPAEAAVARLVADGRTNREVAAELLVSPKTVEFHLGSVFRKLGVTSRTELPTHP